MSRSWGSGVGWIETRTAASFVLGCLACLGFVQAAGADTVDARCDIYPANEDRASAVIPCTFSQRQGYIIIDRSDGVVHDLRPTGDEPGNFLDQDDRPVYRQSGLGEDGLIFRLPDESIYVYWDESSVSALGAGNSATAPYSTADYDATALLPCSMSEPSHDQSCPAGILRPTSGSASIRILNPAGDERLLEFDNGDVTTPGDGELMWSKQDDEWHIDIDNLEFYVVPEAAIYGG